MSKHTLNLIKENEVRWVDLRFTDTRGKEQHVTIPSKEVHEDFFEGGKMFDGSSISGWKGINDSDMVLMPDDSTSVLDPFTDDATVILRCNVVEPTTMQGYDRDPRSVAQRAEDYLKTTGIGYVTSDGYDFLAKHAHNLAIYEGFDGHALAVSELRKKLMRKE